MWQNLTEAQATIIAACITVLAAIVGVSLGARLFGNRVRDLQSALDTSATLVNDHASKVENALESIRSRLESVETQARTTTESLGQVRGSIGDLSASTTNATSDVALDARETLKTAWDGIRDTLESIAVDPNIDGRTRAKYARIDRRNYHWLVDSLDWDGMLGSAGDKFREAVDIWHKYRPNKKAPTEGDVSRAVALRDQLKPLAPQEPA